MNRLLAAFALVATPLAAQLPRDLQPVDSGRVIRFQTGDVVTRGRLLGQLRFDADSAMYCRMPGPPCQGRMESWQVGWVHPTVLEHLDVQVGSNAAKGARIGLVVGAVLTFGFYGLGQSFCEYQCLSDTEILIRSVFYGGLWGGGIGALYGSGSPRMERRF